MYIRITKIIAIVVAICISLTINAQTGADSARQRDSISALIDKETNSVKLALLFNQLAYRHLDLGETDQLISAAEKSLSFCRQTDFKDLAYDNSLLLARTYRKMNSKPEEALHYYVEAKSGLDRNTDEGKLAIADIDNEIGLLYFNRRHYNRANENFSSALTVFQKANDTERIRQTTNHLAVCTYLNGDYEESATCYEKLLDYYQRDNDFPAQKQTMQRLADIYQKLKQYDKALDINYKLYDLCADGGDTPTALNTLNNIAYCQVLNGNSADGINMFKQIADVDNLGHPSDDQLAGTYTNLGLCYQNMGNNKECYEYLSKAMKLRKDNGQIEQYSQVGNILALIYLKNKDLHNAENSCLEALEAADSSGNPQLQRDAYQTYNQILQAKGEYDKALVYYQKYLNLRDSAMIHQMYDERELSEDLRNMEEAEKNYSDEIVEAELKDLNNRRLKSEAESERRRNELLEKDLELNAKEKDIIQQNLLLARQRELAIRRDKELSDLQARSAQDSLKLKEQELVDQKRLQEIHELENERKNQELALENEKKSKQVYRLMIALFGLVVAVFFVIFIIVRKKNQKLNSQKAEIEIKNADLLLKNEEINMQKENLQRANKEIMNINEEISRQKEIIETKNKSITDSIVYAHRIQQAVCPAPDFIKELGYDYFLFFRPKEIVSGDFYWFYREGDILFAATADCTGHGVPGAFMSMLGSSLFNKIVSERKIFAPDKILDNLRSEVKKALHQENMNSKSKDGMDLSLIKVNTKTLVLEFAGANNNGYLFRHFDKDQEELANQNIEGRDFVKPVGDGFVRLTTLKADRMPIGVYIRDDNSFTSKSIQLCHGDAIYLTSDGYLDQFGGDNGRKYLSGNFTQMLADINHLPMEQQCRVVIETHEKWIGDKFSQIDDIIVFGLKIR
ncbi:MAG: tetratricopeptide repeat protein [Bacteroidales bacterium]|nr:tetratricopeptide repeat protein [Bacteroidales bacterium]